MATPYSVANDVLRYLGQLCLALFGVGLFLAALYFYNIHMDIEDAMEGVCDSGDIIVEILTYDDCNEAQQTSNQLRTWAIGCGFFGLVLMYGAQKSYSDSEKVKSNLANIPNVVVESPPLPNVEIELPKEEMGDKFSEIERLGELKDKGLLTEEEFQAEKSKLLK